MGREPFPFKLSDGFRIPLFGGPSLVPREITAVMGISLGSNETPEPEVKEKKLPKPSLLFILTGLGRYSWYKLPFLKGIFCAGLPSVLMFHVCRILRYGKGSCKCRKASCRYVSIFGLCVGLCKEAKKQRKGRLK